MFNAISHLIGSVDSAGLLSLAIALCAFVFEDFTTVIVAVLCADGVISVPTALLSIYAGIALGDTVLYTLGSLARSHPRLANYIEHDFTAPFRDWLQHTYAFKVFSGHFVPGLRVTSFVASGFFRLPLTTYIPMAILGGLTLEGVLFSVSYWFSSATTEFLGPVRYAVALIFLFVFLLIGRKNLRTYRARKEAAASTDEAPQE